MAATTATAIIAGGTLLGVAGNLAGAANEAAANRAQAEYERQISESNARNLELKAEDAIRRGDIEAGKVRRSTRKLVGSQRTSLVGQGVDINSGTGLDLQTEANAFGNIDALTVKNNAWREAWGYKTQATESRFAGRFAGIAAKQKSRSTLLTGGLQALGTGLQGIAAIKG